RPADVLRAPPPARRGEPSGIRGADAAPVTGHRGRARRGAGSVARDRGHLHRHDRARHGPGFAPGGRARPGSELAATRGWRARAARARLTPSTSWLDLSE